MMLKRIVVVSVASLGLSELALPQTGPGNVSGTQAIAARQASMDMSSVVLHSIAEAIRSGREARTEAYAATALAKWAKVVPTMFPQDTAKGDASADTQALAEIWKDRAGFNRVAANYAAAAAELALRAKANDNPGFIRQLLIVDQACRSCHTHYKDGMQSAPLDMTSH